MLNFFIGEFLKAIVLFGTAYLLGRWIALRGIRVNYTRKIFHFVLFFFPLALADRLPYPGSRLTTVASGLVLLGCLCAFVEPLRLRSTFLATAYSAIDRPEDRPFTLVWISTQIIATYAVIVLVVSWLSMYGKAALVYVAVLIAGIGDGLAEPVGVRFGRHKYRVRALFTDRTYTRSIEGSACVFLSAVLAVCLLRDQLSQLQIVFALLIVPPATTLAEAVSPHTWDGPSLYLAGGASIVGALELASRFG